MSWRASASRPAPPVTSTSVDSLFGASTPSHRPSRTSSNSSAAANLLARQMSDADDGASIRSARSTLTVSGRRWTDGRSRATSSASSIATRNSDRNGRTMNERSNTELSQSSDKDEEADAPNESPQQAIGQNLVRPESAGGSGRVLPVIKRKRVEKRQENGSALSDQNQSPSLDDPPPLSLSSNEATGEPLDARSSPESNDPATSQTRRGWFGRPQPQPQTQTQPAATTTASAETSSSDNDQQVVSADLQTKARQLALQKASAAIVGQSASTGWFSSFSKASAPPSDRSEDHSSAYASATEDSMDEQSADEGAGRDDLGAHSDRARWRNADSSARADATLRTNIRTPRPDDGVRANVTRGSWWGWGGASTDTIKALPPSSAMASQENTEVDLSSQADSTASESAALPQQPTNKSWLATIWRDQATEIESKKRKVEDEGLATKTAAMAIDDGSEPNPSTSSEVSARFTPPSLAIPLPVQVAALKNKASWSLFPSRRAAASSNVSPSTSLAQSSNLAPSDASTRSDNSAPDSPYLAPHQDNPVKPLTGSVRSSPRPSMHEPDPPLENLVLPTFEDTFERPPRSFPPEKSRLSNAATKAVSVVSAYLFSQPAPPSPPVEKRIKVDPAMKLPKSLSVMEEAPRLDKVKRVVTIGVHGWFPTQRLKMVFGEPTGTSVKFATMMHDAVHSYLESKDVNSFNIQAIALEGHGVIEDRVNKLYDQLMAREEWVESLRRADAVFVATHSQGSVASTQLLARMLEQGLVSGPKTHLLCMAGIAQGPFAYLNQSYALSPYFTYVESAPARELFEFQDGESIQTRKFLDSLRIVLASGIKMTVIGSSTDQVVPLYSALFSGISHPGLLRAVYIDSDAFRTSDFLANLVVFAARLRNAGLHDHDLIYHVSEALAGALTGVGHSKIYEEADTFTLAVRYHFETTAMAESPTLLDSRVPSLPLSWSFDPRERRNPYLLTWSLRGIVEDPQIRELFTNELQALREAFETWRPQTKVLKDVKMKLEGIRMLPRAKKDGKL